MPEQEGAVAQDDKPHGPITDHVQRPDHWLVLGHAAALGRWAHASHIHFHDKERGVDVHWNSREHRKGHYPHYHHPGHRKNRWGWLYHLIGFDVTSIAWWIAFIFTIGSAVWVINGWFVLFTPCSETFNEYMIGYSALMGGTLFEIGAILAFLEAVNTAPEVRELPTAATAAAPAAGGIAPTNGAVKPQSGQQQVQLAHLQNGPTGYYQQPNQQQPYQQQAYKQQQQQQQQQKHDQPYHVIAVMDDTSPESTSDSGSLAASAPPQQQQQQLQAQQQRKRKWKWWAFRWRDLGWLGAAVQLVGATVFEIACITGVPNLLPDPETHDGLWDGVFWTPQVVGAPCFIISAAIFMLEVQRHWWAPRPFNLSWHVGLWNLVGGVGFLLSGVFGYYAYPAQKYQTYGTDLSTFWGGWAFLLGSYLQWIESLNKVHN